MAQFCEGDWSEIDCFEWSKAFFKSHLTNVAVATAATAAEASVTITKLQRLDGEAYVNVRKIKVIPGYELSLLIAWEGQLHSTKVSGAAEIPYLADGENPEVRVRVKEDGEVASKLKEVMATKGKDVILEKVRVWEARMAEGGPLREELAAEKAAERKAARAAKEAERNKKGFKMISLTERFRCRARGLFEIMMDENMWKGFTQRNARISREVGGEFSVFDGCVIGRNLELQVGNLIVQSWRFRSWPDGMQSTVRIVFEEPETGVTVVKLTHSDVPEEDRYGNATVVKYTERWWRDHIFQRIRAVFNFGI